MSGFLSTADRDVRLRPAVRRRPASGTAAAAIPLSGLIDWWDLAESSGSRAGAHAGITLAEDNGVTTAVALARRYQSLAGAGFDAGTKYLGTTGISGFAPGVSGATLHAWIRWRNQPSYTVGVTLFDSRYSWVIAAEGSQISCYILANNILSATAVVDGVSWVHVVLRYRPSDHAIDLFVNGVKRPTVTGTSVPTATVQLRLSRDNEGYSMTGDIGQVAVWSLPLSDAECVGLYNGGQSYHYAVP